MSLDGPLHYFGGKKLIARHIIPHFPKGPTLYVEPFFGGGGVFFQVPKELFHVQVINDLNKGIITFYRVLQTRTDELIRVCELTPYALEEHQVCKRFSEDNFEDELEVARRVWVRSRQSFSGMQTPTVGWRRPIPGASHAAGSESRLRQFQQYADRMLGVCMYNQDAIHMIQQYQHLHAFIYEDPPYHAESRVVNEGYQHEMTTDQHETLAQANHTAAGAGARIMVSGYGGVLYDRLYQSWRRVSFDRAITTTAREGSTTATEVLWMNYPASEEIGARWQDAAIEGKNSTETAILKALRGQGIVR